MNNSEYSLRELICLFSQNNSFKIQNTQKLLLWTLIVLFVSLRKKQRESVAVSKTHPVFILGHWRSGTTSLQEALSTFTGLKTSDMFFSTFGGTLNGDDKVTRWFLEGFCRLFNLSDPIHGRRFTWDMPTEELHAITTSLYRESSSWGFVFPKHYEEYVNRYLFSDQDTEDKKLMDLRYTTVIENLLHYHDRPTQIILKSPENTGRIETLHSSFPKASYVYIHRKPKEVYHSMFNFWKTILRFYSFQTISDDEIVNNICSTYQKLIRNYLFNRHLIRDSLVEVNFSDFVHDQWKTVHTISENLSLKVVENDFQNLISRTQTKPKQHLFTPHVDFNNVIEHFKEGEILYEEISRRSKNYN